jgi:hypothetical protein
MSFWNTKLIKNLQDGELPDVKTEVTIDKNSLVTVGIVLASVAVVIALMVIIVKKV